MLFTCDAQYKIKFKNMSPSPVYRFAFSRSPFSPDPDQQVTLES